MLLLCAGALFLTEQIVLSGLRQLNNESLLNAIANHDGIFIFRVIKAVTQWSHKLLPHQQLLCQVVYTPFCIALYF